MIGWGHRVHIPRNSATQSRGKLPPNPWQSCRLIHGKAATHGRCRLPPSERSDAEPDRFYSVCLSLRIAKIGHSSWRSGAKKVSKATWLCCASHPLRRVNPVCSSRTNQSCGSPPSGSSPSRGIDDRLIEVSKRVARGSAHGIRRGLLEGEGQHESGDRWPETRYGAS